MSDLKDIRVLVTPTSYGRYNQELKANLESRVGEVIYNSTGKPLTSKQVASLLPGVQGYIAGLDQIDQAALAEADVLKVIVRYGVGYENVDLDTAREKGIIVSNTPGANSASVAELAICLLLMLARQIPAASRAVRVGDWPRLKGISLEGKTIGIIGLGAIGKLFALRLHGFKTNILAYDPFADQDFAQQHEIELVDIQTLTANSDFISLHCPVTTQTKNMVDDAFIHVMKKGAYLINTARGELVVESALIKGLESGQVAGAALDAFQNEPPDIKNPLLSFQQVIPTPHLGAQTDGSTNNMGKMALEECIRVLKGETPKYQIN